MEETNSAGEHFESSDSALTHFEQAFAKILYLLNLLLLQLLFTPSKTSIDVSFVKVLITSNLTTKIKTVVNF